MANEGQVKVTLSQEERDRVDHEFRKKFRALEYLNDLLTIKKMFGDHSYASHLELFINNLNS